MTTETQWIDAATSQRIMAATRSWKRQERDSPLEPGEGAPPRHSDSGSVKQILDIWPSEQWLQQPQEATTPSYLWHLPFL